MRVGAWDSIWPFCGSYSQLREFDQKEEAIRGARKHSFREPSSPFGSCFKGNLSPPDVVFQGLKHIEVSTSRVSEAYCHETSSYGLLSSPEESPDASPEVSPKTNITRQRKTTNACPGEGRFLRQPVGFHWLKVICSFLVFPLFIASGHMLYGFRRLKQMEVRWYVP